MDYGVCGQSNAADLKQTAFQSLELDHIKKESRRRENHMTAEVSRGHLEYHDERGSYRIPVGRRGRKCLAILDKREGEYVRSLEMDLFTGFVYYCVDNATTGGLSYYYDMSSKKVSHYFIHRYLRNAMNRGFKATPLELEVFEKLPCENWVEEMERLPGWKEAIEHRVENLLLPGRKVLSVHVRGMEEMEAGAAADVSDNETPARIELISFSVYPSSYPSGIRDHIYLFERENPDRPAVLCYRNKIIGNEFFGEDGEYEIFLTEKEDDRIRQIAEEVFSAREENSLVTEDGLPALEALASLQKEHDGEEMVLKEMSVRYTDGTVRRTEGMSPLATEHAENLRTILHGLLRREVILE